MDATDVATRDEDKRVLDCLFGALDEKSRALLWHLWWNRHAQISELRELIGASQDYEVLYRLNEVINRKSEAMLGRPIVAFEHSRVDPLTGEKVLFSWWFLEIGECKLPQLDMFEEKDRVVIIAQLSGDVDWSHPEVIYKNGILQIMLKKGA